MAILWKFLKILFSILTNILAFLKILKKKDPTDELIQRDREVADNIKLGNGEKIAEEWKKRRIYDKSK